MILAKLYTGLHVEYQLFLSDFNQNLIFGQLKKILKYKIS